MLKIKEIVLVSLRVSTNPWNTVTSLRTSIGHGLYFVITQHSSEIHHKIDVHFEFHTFSIIQFTIHKYAQNIHIHTRTLHCMYMSKVFFLPQRLHSLHLYIQDMADKCYNHLQTTLFRRYICQECLSNHTIKLYTVHVLKYRVNEMWFMKI